MAQDAKRKREADAVHVDLYKISYFMSQKPQLYIILMCLFLPTNPTDQIGHFVYTGIFRMQATVTGAPNQLVIAPIPTPISLGSADRYYQH